MIPWNYESQNAQRRADLRRFASKPRNPQRGNGGWRVRRPYFHKGSD